MSSQMDRTPASEQQHDFRNGCVAFHDQFETPYGYLPSLGVGVVFLALFGLSASTHLFQAARRRRATSFVFATGALVEFVGWIARTWSSMCPYNRPAFLIQLTALVIAPAFLLAGSYIILRLLMLRVGPESSYMSANMCFYVLLASNILSLVVQILGIGLAFRALDTMGSTKLGISIMIAGTASQLVSIIFFFLLLLDFLRRIRHDFGLTESELWVVGGMFLSVIAVLIRSAYRIAEYAGGWKGYVSTHESFFIGLDSVMMVIAVAVYNFIDPAILLRSKFSHTPVRIYVDDGSMKSEIIYRGETFEMVKLNDDV